MTRTAFLVMFPEFGQTDTNLIDAHLAACALEVDADVFGTSVDTAIGYLTAARLAASPYGQNVRIQSKDGKTQYSERYSELVQKFAKGCRVV